jgi:hypothetical protein
MMLISPKVHGSYVGGVAFSIFHVSRYDTGLAVFHILESQKCKMQQEESVVLDINIKVPVDHKLTFDKDFSYQCGHLNLQIIFVKCMYFTNFTI